LRATGKPLCRLVNFGPKSKPAASSRSFACQWPPKPDRKNIPFIAAYPLNLP
jgi:hypothetical protein